MNVTELRKILMMENVPKDMYSFTETFPSETYCLHYTGDFWEVYYSERGQKTDLRTFRDEQEACEYFYNLIRKEIGS